MVKAVENLKKRKESGGKTHSYRDRRAAESDSYAFEPDVGASVQSSRRRRGGELRTGLRSSDVANVFDPTSSKTSKVKITRVNANPANREYERRGVITRGATIETELGVARVTSRPSRDGVVNAVLLNK